VLFSLKRAFHLSVAAGLLLTRPFGLTPARFDLLYALDGDGMGAAGRQCFLRHRLGVSAPTVSRMVTSLEELGLVERLRDAKGNSCGVRLTDAGKRRLAQAKLVLIDRGAAWRMVRLLWPRKVGHRALEPAAANARAASADNLATIYELVRVLKRVRRTLYDRAYLEYRPFVSRARRELGPEGAIVPMPNYLRRQFLTTQPQTLSSPILVKP
ncbi:MAG: MarR family, partial [Myxococcaceae bacterium]|nr:MarR family [Myxococcaceae bacterium]